jgi:glycosyltransferase involved in cell wall biosynthesis
MIELSVILPTYNPDLTRLNQTLSGLKNQSMDVMSWELIIIDNNSSNNFSSNIDLSWHPNAFIVSEPRQGLTHARLRGFAEANADIIVMVDDDNILDPNYLSNAVEIFKAEPQLGAAGGKSLPLFESDPPKWLGSFYGILALRNLGEKSIIESWDNKYPLAAPIGAGMTIRKAALKMYLENTGNSQSLISDRTGDSLSSGGDNDIVLWILRSGWQTGYFPQLKLQHIIPASRVQVSYLAQLQLGINRSWVQVLAAHQICPWKPIAAWSQGLRKFKAYFKYSAWKNPVNYLRWKAACGMFEGLASIC